MRIELTVTAADRSVDLAILSREAVPLAQVTAAVTAAAGASEGADIWSGERRLTPQTRLGEPGLRTGARLTLGAPHRDHLRPGVLSLHVVGGLEAGRVIAIQRGRLTIGRSADCDLVLSDDRASRVHAALEINGGALVLHDLTSTNGTALDGAAVPPGGAALRSGQLIRVGDTLLTVRGPDDAPAALSPSGDGRVLVNRAPRLSAPVTAREIAPPQRPDSARPRGVQWIAALLPAAAGCGLAWFTHSPQFLLFALLSPVMMVSTALGDRLHWRRSRRRAVTEFAQRRAEADRQIVAGLAAETRARRANAPDAGSVWRMAAGPSSRLWERRRSDADALHLRLGSAELPSALQIRTAATLEPAGRLAAVPLCVDLRDGPLGLAGPEHVVAGLAYWLLVQIVVLHSPHDVEIGFLVSADTAPRWSWARWLPHLQGHVAAAPDEWPELVAALGARREHRHARPRHDPHGWSGGWFVLVVDRASALSDVPGLAVLLADGPAFGVTAICIDSDEHALPTACAAIARVRGDTGSRLTLRRGASGGGAEAVVDRVTREWSAGVARALAPLVDSGGDESTTLPDACRLLDAAGRTELDVTAVLTRWAASTGRPDTVLGIAADGPLRIDLVTDGPHALIAGTTGAGKSELLQSLVAGLAADHPPDEVTFLLIDYKGGAAFAECAGLPHTTGLVTDLDPHLTTRALLSLNAELHRRERLLAGAGAVDIDGYRRAAAVEPLPRLIIVVDEFAALNEELPDFIRGLVGVAQRGRSLGVHLVLATQRPGSAVSAEIRANTSLRVALRVTDAAESIDVIDAPDAATIPGSLPGRAYLRTGTRLTCFQAGRIGGAAETGSASPVVTVLDPWRRRPAEVSAAAERTDLAGLVETLRAAARHGRRPMARSPWFPPLPSSIAVAAAAAGTDAAGPIVTFGTTDLPARQAQAPLTLDLTDPTSVLIVGGPRSGRTTALLTVAVGAAAQLAPDRLEIYVIDATGALSAAVLGLPHLATRLGPDDGEVAAALLRRLDRVVGRRLASPPAADSPAHPRLLLLVDGWDTLSTALGDAEATRCGELLASLLRTGSSAGLTTIITGDRTLLTPRFAGPFAERLLLRLDDRADYGFAGIPVRDVPSTLPPGRGVRASDGVEFQIAYTGASAADDDARSAVAAVGQRWAASAPSAHAIRIRALPARVGWAELPHQEHRLAIGLAGDAAEPLLLDPFAGAGRLLVAGPPRSGRSTTLRLLLLGALRIGLPTVVAAGRRSPLVDLARRHDIPVVDPGSTAAETGPTPTAPTLLLVDDSEAFQDCEAGDQLAMWLTASGRHLAAVVAGRCDDLATTYRGIAADVRRNHCAVLLRPGPIDGELVGIRLPRRAHPGPPGRGVIVGDAAWGPLFADGAPVPLQVAAP